MDSMIRDKLKLSKIQQDSIVYIIWVVEEIQYSWNQGKF